MDNYRSKLEKMVLCTLFIENERFLHLSRTIFESLSVISLKKSKEHHLYEYLAASLVAQKVDR